MLQQLFHPAPIRSWRICMWRQQILQLVKTHTLQTPGIPQLTNSHHQCRITLRLWSTLTAPVVNNTFGVRSIASSSTDGTVLVLSTSDTTWTAPSFPLSSTPYSTRISSITFDVTNFAGALRWPIAAPARNMRHSRYIGATRRGTCIWRSIYPMLNRVNCCKGSRAACSVRVGNLCILTFE